MRVLVYTTKRWAISARRLLRSIGGFDVEFLTSPPMTADEFLYHSLSAYDIVYFRLHGLPGQSRMYGASFRRKWGQAAFSLDGLKSSKLRFYPDKTRVFFEGCFAYQTGIPQELVARGAAEVYASTEETSSGVIRVSGAALLGKAVLQAWQAGMSAAKVIEVGAKDVRGGFTAVT